MVSVEITVKNDKFMDRHNKMWTYNVSLTMASNLSTRPHLEQQLLERVKVVFYIFQLIASRVFLLLSGS